MRDDSIFRGQLVSIWTVEHQVRVEHDVVELSRVIVDLLAVFSFDQHSDIVG
jgi:hypothetical protein